MSRRNELMRALRDKHITAPEAKILGDMLQVELREAIKKKDAMFVAVVNPVLLLLALIESSIIVL